MPRGRGDNKKRERSEKASAAVIKRWSTQDTTKMGFPMRKRPKDDEEEFEGVTGGHLGPLTIKTRQSHRHFLSRMY